MDHTLRQGFRPDVFEVIELLLNDAAETGRDLAGARTEALVERAPAGQAKRVGALYGKTAPCRKA